VALSATAGGEDDEQVVLSVARAAPGFSDEERERFQNLARQAGVSLGNVALHKQLARQATTDELTGLLNHRRLHEALSDELEHGPRFRKAVALVLLDIDDFKRVNDTHGHQCGDEVLYAVARAVESGAREGDHVARYGGEEIAVVLPHAGLDQAQLVAERIRRRIESVAVSLPDGGFVRPTASLGVAVLAGGGDKAALIAAADAALYDAKRAGKNRTVCAGERAGAARRP
jgi:diguanylate cyclase (GGDEF)-like protein